MDRREFCFKLTVVGGTLAFAPLISSCASESVSETPHIGPIASATPFPSPTPRPTNTPPTQKAPSSAPTPSPEAFVSPTPLPGTSQIAIVHASDRAEGVRQALELLGVNPVHGERVLLKPNFNSADPAPGSTDPATLRALVGGLFDLGAKSITVADRSGMGSTRQVMQQIGILDLAREMAFDTIVLDELDHDEWVVRSANDLHWSAGFAVPRLLLDAECVVQTCNLKTHRYGGHFTLSLKNSVGFAAKTLYPGGYDYMRELHSSPHQRHMIAEINTAYEPALIVMDGVEAFVEGGPATGKKVRPEVVLAGTDRVAIDAVGVAILRLFGTTPEVTKGSVFEQEQIARAAELELGVRSPEQIGFLAADAKSQALAEQITELLQSGT